MSQVWTDQSVTVRHSCSSSKLGGCVRQSTAASLVRAWGCVSMFILLTSERSQDYCPRRRLHVRRTLQLKWLEEVMDIHFESTHTVMGASSDLAKSLVMQNRKFHGPRLSRTKDTVSTESAACEDCGHVRRQRERKR